MPTHQPPEQFEDGFDETPYRTFFLDAYASFGPCLRHIRDVPCVCGSVSVNRDSPRAGLQRRLCPNDEKDILKVYLAENTRRRNRFFWSIGWLVGIFPSESFGYLASSGWWAVVNGRCETGCLSMNVPGHLALRIVD